MFFLRAYLWVAPHLLLLFALLWMFRRKLHEQYSFFVAYLVLQLTYFVTMFTLDLLGGRHLASRNEYLWALIIGLCLTALAEMAILCELAAELIFSRVKDSSPLKSILHWTAGTSVLVAVLLAASLAWTSSERLINIFQTLDAFSNLVALGLLFAIVVLTRVLSIPWRSLNAGIALGLGVSAATELAESEVLSKLGTSKEGYIASDLVRMTGFHICAVIWLVYILLPGSSRGKSEPDLQVSELELHSPQVQRMAGR